jgi:hypothetical protein
VLLHLKRAPDGTRTLASVQRVGADLPESILVLSDDGWPELAGTRREHQARRVAEDVLAFLRDHGEAIRGEILENVPGDNTAKVAALALLEAEGRVTKSGAGRRGNPYRYALVDSVLPPGTYPADGKKHTQNRHEVRFYQGEIPSARNGWEAAPADGIPAPWEPQPPPLARAGEAPSEAPQGGITPADVVRIFGPVNVVYEGPDLGPGPGWWQRLRRQQGGGDPDMKAGAPPGAGGGVVERLASER